MGSGFSGHDRAVRSCMDEVNVGRSVWIGLGGADVACVVRKVIECSSKFLELCSNTPNLFGCTQPVKLQLYIPQYISCPQQLPSLTLPCSPSPFLSLVLLSLFLALSQVATALSLVKQAGPNITMHITTPFLQTPNRILR